MNMEINLNPGVETIKINFGKFGTEEIYCNPNDTSFGENLYKLYENIMARIEEFKNEDFNIDKFGNPVFPEDADFESMTDEEKEKVLNKIKCQFEIMGKTNKIFYDEIDKMFIGNASEVIFKYCNPLAMVNDEFYVAQFIKNFCEELNKNKKKQQKEQVGTHVKEKKK